MMWNGTILDNRTRLLMKLLTTRSANIIQECRVMFGVKSVLKSIFKLRHNVLPVVVFKMANIRGIKLNNAYIISATQLTAQLTLQRVNVRKTLVTESQHHEMIVQVITVRLVQTQNHGNLRPTDGAPAHLLFQLGNARRTESLMPTRHKRKSCITLLDETHFTHILRRRCTARKSGALSCRLKHSCSAMDRHMHHAVFHTIAFFLHFHVSHFPPLQHGAAFSCPAISCLAFSASPCSEVSATVLGVCG